MNGTPVLEYAYDMLGRSVRRTLGTSVPFVTEYAYLAGGDASRTTTLVQKVKNGEDTSTYTYDELGNITAVSVNGIQTEAYTYDELGQLTGAVIGGDTYTYTYDAGGNLTTRTKNGETAAVYGYSSVDWKDLLTSYNGVGIAYDGIGNPLNWKAGESFTWSNGRQLTGITKDGRSITYSYSESGERTSKVVDGEETAYYWLNGILLGQECGNSQTSFLYDEAGRAFGLIHNGAYYYYVWNQQGDVIGIIDSEGTRVVEYSYGAWGELLSVTGTMADTIGQENPLRYRGYYYDGETGFYYLGSRYYDPEVGRFISADTTDILDIQYDLYDKNLYAYCDNNPIIRADNGGEFWHIIVGAVVGVATQYVCDVVTNLATGKSFTEALRPTSTWADYGASALSGALAATGIGLGASVAANATIGGATYLINCGIKGEEANLVDLGLATGIGAVSGLIGGKGADGAKLRGVTATSKKILKTAVSPQKIAMYSRKIAACKSSAIFSVIRTVSAGGFTNAVNFVRGAICYDI